MTVQLFLDQLLFFPSARLDGQRADKEWTDAGKEFRKLSSCDPFHRYTRCRTEAVQQTNTDLCEGPCCQRHVPDYPQRYQDDRGQQHEPTQARHPARVNVPVQLEGFVVNQVQQEANLWHRGQEHFREKKNPNRSRLISITPENAGMKNFQQSLKKMDGLCPVMSSMMRTSQSAPDERSDHKRFHHTC